MAEGHKRPAPDEGLATDPEAERVQSEDAGRRRDVGEGHGEAGVDAERSPQLLPVAEPRQVTNVGMVGFFLQLVPLPGLGARPKRLLQKLEGSYHSLLFPSTRACGRNGLGRGSGGWARSRKGGWV